MGVGQKNVNVEPKKEQNHITCLRSAEQKSAPTEKKKIGHSTSGNRTRGVCVTGRNVTNYTNADLLLEIRQKHCLCCCSLIRAWSAYNSKPQASSFGHTTVDIPHLVRTAKSSTLGPNQYCGGGPRGNLRCRMFFFFFANFFFVTNFFLSPIFFVINFFFHQFFFVTNFCGRHTTQNHNPHHSVIPRWIYRISSELRSQAPLGLISTAVGDHAGILGAECFFVF